MIKKSWQQIWLICWFALALTSSQSSGEYFLSRTLGSPSLFHPFGFDAFGRDLFLTVLRGSTISAFFAFIAVVISFVFGLSLGALLATSSNRLRFTGLRFLEFFLAFPSLLFALACTAVLGPGWISLIIALSLGTVPPFIRLVYVRSRELMREDYILAAQSLGSTRGRVILKHFFPALISFCMVKVPNLFAQALMAEATLSFLGVGAPIGHDTWGSLLAQGKDYLLEAPHVALGSGVPLVMTILALQSLMDKRRVFGITSG